MKTVTHRFLAITYWQYHRQSQQLMNHECTMESNCEISPAQPYPTAANESVKNIKNIFEMQHTCRSINKYEYSKFSRTKLVLLLLLLPLGLLSSFLFTMVSTLSYLILP